MPSEIVVNTGTILAIVAGFGNLDTLHQLYDTVYVTNEVRTK